ncbi:MAG: hypothetical protein K2X47_01865, partial [Bdellovibrionales bacterium]|nr:hypothetical protein [Bdellovibrionales bacterium]
SLVIGNDIGNNFSIQLNSSTNTSLGGAGSVNLYSPAMAPMTFSTWTSERMRIDANGNVGIGTTTPSRFLHVHDAGYSQRNIRISDPGGSIELGYGNNSGDYLLVHGRIGTTGGAASHPAYSFSPTSDHDTGMFRVSENVLGFTTGGVEKFRIDSSGNVGIGTTNPGSLLHIAKSNNDALYAMTVENSNNNNTANNGVLIKAGKAGTGTLFSLRVQDFIANDLFVIKPEGDVGIGTPSPVSKLHVGLPPTATANYGLISLGSGFFDGSTAGFFTGHASGTLIAANVAGAFGGDLINLQAAGVQRFKVDKDGKIYGDGSTLSNISGSLSGLTAGRVPFATSSTALSDDGNLFWDNTNKRLGIGTTSPGQLLEVNGGMKAQRYLSGINDGNEYMHVEAQNVNSGGTTSISAINNAATSVNDAVSIKAYGTAVATSGAVVADGGALISGTNLSGGLSISAAHSSGVLRMYTGGTAAGNERMRIDSSGNIGVGTTNPNLGLLHVSNSTNQAALYVSQSYGGTADIMALYDNWTGQQFKIQPVSSFGINLNVPTNGGLRFSTNNTAAMTILNTGNVGIGTSSPGFLLDVAGNAEIEGTLQATGGYINFNGQSEALNDTYINHPSDGVIQVVADGTAMIRADKTKLIIGNVPIQFNIQPSVTISESWGLNLSGASNQPVQVNNASLLIGYAGGGSNFGTGNLLVSGNVGIGTTNPNAKLEVAGLGEVARFSSSAGDQYISIQNTAGTQRKGLVLDDNGGTDFWMFSDSGNSPTPELVFNTGGFYGARQMVLTSAGNLGVGASNPQQKLQLAGAMRLEPQASPPGTASNGDIYYDTSHAVCAYVNGSWSVLAGPGSCN